MKEGRKPEYPEKTPDDELQKMPHTKAQKFKRQARLEHAQQHWWQARNTDVLTTHHTSPCMMNATTDNTLTIITTKATSSFCSLLTF